MENVSALLDTHDFWDGQPVPKMDDKVSDEAFDAAIDKFKTPDEIQNEPLALPPGFHWADVDIFDDDQANDVY